MVVLHMSLARRCSPYLCFAAGTLAHAAAVIIHDQKAEAPWWYSPQAAIQAARLQVSSFHRRLLCGVIKGFFIEMLRMGPTERMPRSITAWSMSSRTGKKTRVFPSSRLFCACHPQSEMTCCWYRTPHIDVVVVGIYWDAVQTRKA